MFCAGLHESHKDYHCEAKVQRRAQAHIRSVTALLHIAQQADEPFGATDVLFQNGRSYGEMAVDLRVSCKTHG